jgi:hypothetical protein
LDALKSTKGLRMLGTRLIACVATGFAVVLAVAGCSLIPNPFPSAKSGSNTSDTSGTPKVGQCWNATDSEADNWADWEGTPAVSCAKSHVLYTYAVGKLTGIKAKTWAQSATSDQVSDAVAAVAADVCTTSALVPKLKWNQQLVQGYYFVPSKADWKAGARWVRCDVGVLAFGATLENEALAPLPAKISTLVSGVSSDPQRYAFCVNSPVPVSESGPLDDSSGRIADCRNNPEWALEGHGNLPEPAGAAYPTTATANTETGAICSKYVTNSNEVWIAYLPSKTDWTKTNDREVDCWVGQKAAETSGGTA